VQAGSLEEYLRERVAQAKPRWIPATVLQRETAERDYAGGIRQLKDCLTPLKHSEPEPVVRFETPPGVLMQVDFTVVRRCGEGVIRCWRWWPRWATAAPAS
jgi:transposase